MTAAPRSGALRAFGYNAAVVLLATPMLTGCASSQDSGRDASLPEVLSDARAHPENRMESAAGCERAIDGKRSDFPYKAFFAGLFDVSEDAGGRAFCAAIIEAVTSGKLTERDLRAFQRPVEVRGKAPLGTLLRKVLEAHERLKAQQAQKPPQA